jgi:hypothetical protein
MEKQNQEKPASLSAVAAGSKRGRPRLSSTPTLGSNESVLKLQSFKTYQSVPWKGQELMGFHVEPSQRFPKGCDLTWHKDYNAVEVATEERTVWIPLTNIQYLIPLSTNS